MQNETYCRLKKYTTFKKFVVGKNSTIEKYLYNFSSFLLQYI